jgi:hypothetical protein
MKAAINGVVNLSVLDGWWDEGYQGDNGWAIKPAAQVLDQYKRNREESQTLYEILQDHVLPLYYARGSQGYSPEWVRLAKRSIATLLPRFNTTRMLDEYVAKLYMPAAQAGATRKTFAGARAVAEWKARVRDRGRRSGSAASPRRRSASCSAQAYGSRSRSNSTGWRPRTSWSSCSSRARGAARARPARATSSPTTARAPIAASTASCSSSSRSSAAGSTTASARIPATSC